MPTKRTSDLDLLNRIHSANFNRVRKDLLALIVESSSGDRSFLLNAIANNDIGAILQEFKFIERTVINEFTQTLNQTLERTSKYISNQTNRNIFPNTQSEDVLNSIRSFSQDVTTTLVRNQTYNIQQILSQDLSNEEKLSKIYRQILLSPNDVQTSKNFENLLRTRDSQALNRVLRDKRFDRSIQASIKGRKTLTNEHIKRIVERYEMGLVRNRLFSLASIVVTPAVSEGSEFAYKEAYDLGILAKDQVELEWNVKQDGLQRDYHNTMNGQRRKEGEPFISGLGNLLNYPGDNKAPLNERINCRCITSRRIVAIT